jgi:hypothetical protein
MKRVKQLRLLAMGAVVLVALLGAATASGTELYKNTNPNDKLGTGTETSATLKTGTSLQLVDEYGTKTDTCTASEVKGKIESPGGEASHPSGKLSGLTFSSCTHTTTVIAKGELEVKGIAGTTNGTVYSKNAEVTVQSTFFGASAVCKTGAGTALGTLTGAGPGEQATIHVNGKIPCGILATASLTGTYLVTEPTGLVAEATASGTELYKNTTPSNDTLGTGTEIVGSLKAGTSLLLKDEFDIDEDTCTASEIKGKIESAASGSTVSGKVGTLTFGSCTHTTTVLAKGSLSIAWNAGTGGTVSSWEAEVTVKSTVFGTSAVCKTGAGTNIGTLKGAGSGEQATIDINAKVNCGILGLASLTGTYLLTEPTGIVVEKS